MMRVLCFLLLVGLFQRSTCLLQDVASWNLLAFNFPEGGQRQEMLYRPENTVLTGLEVGDSKLFLAAPRLYKGVPATLATIPISTPPGSSPVLRAFPDWSWHEAGTGATNISCSGLVSVYRMRADSCGRLWVLDSGIMDSIDDFTRVCPPKIIIFDMDSGRPLRSVTFPEQLLRPNSLFTNIIIDETTSSPGCDDVFAYISDTAAPGMVVYDARADSAWRVTHAAMYPDPDFSEYRIGEDKFTLMDGIVGLAFSPRLRTVYFQPLATDRTFSISTAALRRGPPADGEELPVVLLGRKSSQGIGLAVDPHTDTLYYSPLTETAVASWNPKTNQHSILAFDFDRLQFAADVRWIPRDLGRVWVLSTRFHKFFLKTVSDRETNIRVMRIVNDSEAFPVSQYYRPRYYRQANYTSVY